MNIRVYSFVAATILLCGCKTAATGEDLSLARMLAGQSAKQGSELAKAVAEADAHPLGSQKNPVPVSMPVGERAYLGSLRCMQGSTPAFDRQGSGGAGPFGNIVDFYRVTCPGAEPLTVVMDMYHKDHVDTRAVPGFTLAP